MSRRNTLLMKLSNHVENGMKLRWPKLHTFSCISQSVLRYHKGYILYKLNCHNNSQFVISDSDEWTKVELTTWQSFPHSQPTFLHIIIPSWQLTVSMGSLICNQHDKLMVKMTILFLLGYIYIYFNNYVNCWCLVHGVTMQQTTYWMM